MLIVDPWWKTNMHKLEQGVTSSNIPTLPQEMAQTKGSNPNHRHCWDQGLHKLQAPTHLDICREQQAKQTQATNNPPTPYLNETI